MLIRGYDPETGFRVLGLFIVFFGYFVSLLVLPRLAIGIVKREKGGKHEQQKNMSKM